MAAGKNNQSNKKPSAGSADGINKVNNQNTGNESPSSDKKDNRKTVVSKKRAGNQLIAVTGKVISFDEEGTAKVDFEDAVYLSQCKGFKVEGL